MTYFLTPDMSCVAIFAPHLNPRGAWAGGGQPGARFVPTKDVLFCRFLLQGSWLFSGDLNLGREGGG